MTKAELIVELAIEHLVALKSNPAKFKQSTYFERIQLCNSIIMEYTNNK